MHLRGIVARDEIRLPAVAFQQALEFFFRDARQDRGVGDLVAVQVQDRQHRPVAGGIQEFVRMPGGRERSCLRFAVTDDAGDHEIRIVEGRPEGVGERVAQLAAFVDRSGNIRGAMARNTAGKGELFEQPLHARFVLTDVRIKLAVASLQPCVRH